MAGRLRDLMPELAENKFPEDLLGRAQLFPGAIDQIDVPCKFGMLSCKKPTIAWIEGAVAGAGLSVAAACDFSIIDEMSKCVFAFVNVGFVPETGAAAVVTAAIGTTRAKELFMSGRVFRGKEGAQMGLFTEAVPKEQLEQRVRQYIEKYANGPTVSYGNIKRMINQVRFSGYNLLTQLEMDLEAECEATEDHREAVYAFLEKRPAQFVGK